MNNGVETREAGGPALPVPLAMAKSWRPLDGCGAADAGGASMYAHEPLTPGESTTTGGARAQAPPQKAMPGFAARFAPLPRTPAC